ncbi:MAG: molybdopterin-guanine dinucleotide biosynthesis protein B [Syntrophaceae bacterium]|jgi:molybdopterin-guanine dinucleotide biosynthesis protein B|nr:molybdopterin-guanine dinucleotide biosynthesis protein B [Syntrophaceae bacterium]
MIPIVSIVGTSDSGKTTLIEKLVPELNRRGYRVATVKHDVHGFDVDREGKDSWRHKQAGAHTVIISSPQKLALIRDVDHDAELTELRDKYIQDVDIILSEGFKRNSQPKIEVFRKERHRELLCTREDNLLAIASNQPFQIGVPCFDLEDARGMVDLIEEKFLKAKELPSVQLKVNGREVPLSPFVRKSILGTVRGMVSALKECETPQRIELQIFADPDTKESEA